MATKMRQDSRQDRHQQDPGRGVLAAPHPAPRQADPCPSNYAGTRAGEITALDGRDVLDGEGRLRDEISISGRGANYGSECNAPLHLELRSELASYMMRLANKENPIFFGRYGGQLTANAAVQILTHSYDRADPKGCSSYSGRRTFIKQLARKPGKHACSIRDVQLLVGPADLRTTQIYFGPSENAASLVAALWSA